MQMAKVINRNGSVKSPMAPTSVLRTDQKDSSFATSLVFVDLPIVSIVRYIINIDESDIKRYYINICTGHRTERNSIRNEYIGSVAIIYNHALTIYYLLNIIMF